MLGFGIGLGTIATHKVTITISDGREYQFNACCGNPEEDDAVFYKVIKGERIEGVSISVDEDNEIVTLNIEDDFIVANLIDFNIDNLDMFISADTDDGMSIYIEAIQEIDDSTIADAISYETYDDSEKEIDVAIDDNEQKDNMRLYPIDFLGIDIRTTLDDLLDKLKSKGFTLNKMSYRNHSADSTEKVTLTGSYAGARKCEIQITTNAKQQVEIIDVIRTKSQNEEQLYEDFISVLEAFIQKYGEPDEYENDIYDFSSCNLLYLIDPVENDNYIDFKYTFNFYPLGEIESQDIEIYFDMDYDSNIWDDEVNSGLVVIRFWNFGIMDEVENEKRKPLNPIDINDI